MGENLEKVYGKLYRFCAVHYVRVCAIYLTDRGYLPYCRRDKGMSNSWSFNWASMATRERESLERRCVESLLCQQSQRTRLAIDFSTGLCMRLACV